jgi:hypothetical protein
VRLVILVIAAVLPALKGMTAEEALAYAFVLYGSALYVASYSYEELVGVGGFMGAVYSIIALAYGGQYPYLLYPETLLGVALAAHFVRRDLSGIESFDRATLGIALSVPFLASTYSLLRLGLIWPSLAYSAALVVLLVAHFFIRENPIPYWASGLLAYFSPFVASLLYPSLFAGSGNAEELFFYGTLALVLIYMPLLFTEENAFIIIVVTPFLLGLTSVLLKYFVPPDYWFLAYAPWMPVAVAASYVFNNYSFAPTSQVSPPVQPPTTRQPTPRSSPPVPPSQSTTQSPPSPQPSVRFIVRGLPPTARAVVYVEGHFCDGDYLIDCPVYGNWRASTVTVNKVTYYPHPASGYAAHGSLVYITYYPAGSAPPQPHRTSAPSRPLNPVTVPTKFDPYALVGRDLGVYRVEKLLGEGGFGYVYLASMGGTKYAVKVLKIQGGKAEEYFQSLFQEASNLVNLSSHPNVVKIYAVDVDLNVIKKALANDFTYYYVQPPRIVMEFMEGRSLDKYLNGDTFYYSSRWEIAIARAVKSVAEALDYIHSNGFVHLDVKPQNVFLTRKPGDPSELPNVDFKLGDLGSAVRVGKPVTQVTTLYAPPEVYLEPARPTMDVFALGMTLYVLLTRKNDRPDLQVMEEAYDCYVKGDMNCVKVKVEEAKKLLASWDLQVNEPYKSLIKAMTYPDPRGRPAARDVAKWLNGVV